MRRRRLASAGVAAMPAAKKVCFFFGNARMKVGKRMSAGPTSSHPGCNQRLAGGRKAVNATAHVWGCCVTVTPVDGVTGQEHQRYRLRRTCESPEAQATTGLTPKYLVTTSLSSAAMEATFSNMNST